MNWFRTFWNLAVAQNAHDAEDVSMSMDVSGDGENVNEDSSSDDDIDVLN